MQGDETNTKTCVNLHTTLIVVKTPYVNPNQMMYPTSITSSNSRKQCLKLQNDSDHHSTFAHVICVCVLGTTPQRAISCKETTRCTGVSGWDYPLALST